MNLRNKIIFLIFVALNVTIYSQNEKWNIKLSGGPVTDGIEFRQMNTNNTALEPAIILKENVSNLGLAAFYKLFKNFYGGIYGSYSTLSGAEENVETGEINGWTGADALWYGLQGNYPNTTSNNQKTVTF